MTDISYAWDFEEQLAALQSLAEVTIKMIEPGNWVVRLDARIAWKEAPSVLSNAAGAGQTIREAVDDLWCACSGDVDFVETRSQTSRRRLKWNGFMWADVPEKRGEESGERHKEIKP